jgi:hypothetical protein
MIQRVSRAAEQTAEYIAYEEFRNGLPHGRFRVIVNPTLARGYVLRRLHLLGMSSALIVIGLLFALTGQPWVGVALVFAAILVKRLVVWRAPKILLHLATGDAAVYREATQQGILEVQRS